jgi:hypothetical protein
MELNTILGIVLPIIIHSFVGVLAVTFFICPLILLIKEIKKPRQSRGDDSG